MIDEKDPHHNSDNDDFPDDDAIIDLTDEIIIKPKEDNGILELTEELANDAPLSTSFDQLPEAGDDEAPVAFDENDEAKPDTAEAHPGPSDLPGEDPFIATTKEELREAEKDEDREITEEFDLSAADVDDIISIDTVREEAEVDLSTSSGDETVEDQKEEDLFDLEEEIELEYELDEDDQDVIDLDDEDPAAEDQIHADPTLDDTEESDLDEDDQEVTEYFDLEPQDPDNIVILDGDRDEDTEIIALAEEEEDSDRLPDLEAVSDLDFGGEDADESRVVDEHETGRSDDITARAVEHSLGSVDDRERDDKPEEADLELIDADDVPDLDQSLEYDEEIMALSDEEPLRYEGDEDLLDLDDEELPEDDNEIIPLDGFNGLEAEADNEIIEITEFDQHFPADGEALLKQSGILDETAEDEDDFLELIDVDEDSEPENDQIIEFGDSSENADDARLGQFFSKDMEEDEPQIPTPETIFNKDLEDILLTDDISKSVYDVSSPTEAGPEDEILEAASELDEERPEAVPDPETVSSENEEFDFNFDPNSIAQQVDRLDTFLSEDTLDEPVKRPHDSNRAGDAQSGPEMEESLTLPPAQIEAAIERIINEKFSGRIEDIIYEVIEKAVAKEINRLKSSLVGNNSIEEDEV